jgi:hypothetical protein
MGYDTAFYGDFKGVSHKVYKQIKKLEENGDDLFQSLEGMNYEPRKKHLFFSSCWKNYDDSIQQMAITLARLDKNIEGQIDCCGDDRKDMWLIKVKNGKVRVFVADIKYKEDTKNDIPLATALNQVKILKRLYEATGDKQYQKELIVASLEQAENTEKFK